MISSRIGETGESIVVWYVSGTKGVFAEIIN